MSRIIMHRGDIGLELVKQERSAHQLSSSDLIGCGSSSSAIADGKLIFRNLTFKNATNLKSFYLIDPKHLSNERAMSSIATNFLSQHFY